MAQHAHHRPFGSWARSGSVAQKDPNFCVRSAGGVDAKTSGISNAPDAPVRRHVWWRRLVLTNPSAHFKDYFAGSRPIDRRSRLATLAEGLLERVARSSRGRMRAGESSTRVIQCFSASATSNLSSTESMHEGAAHTSSCTGRCEPGDSPFADEIAFELRKGCEDVDNEAAAGGARVDSHSE